MNAPTIKRALPARSFNASVARFNLERRGKEPDNVWGARAVEAIKPWEEGDLCLSHAVAAALEAAYEEGRKGTKPRFPDLRAELRPSNQASCEDCTHPDVVRTDIVRHAGNLYEDGIDRTPPQTTPTSIARKTTKPPLIVRRANTRTTPSTTIKPSPITRHPAKR